MRKPNGWYKTEQFGAKLEKYLSQGLMLSEIAAQENAAVCMICFALRYHGLTSNGTNKMWITQRSYAALNSQRDEIRREILNGRSYIQLSKIYKVSPSLISRFCQSMNIISQRTHANYVLRTITKECFEELVKTAMSRLQIGNKLGISDKGVDVLLKRFGLCSEWSPNGQYSFPCETMKQILQDNKIPYTAEFRPLKTRRYRIDIAFPNHKFGIEINGSRHYTEWKCTTLTPYHQERHDLITQAGWELIEVPYYDVFKPDKINTLIETIKAKISVIVPDCIYDDILGAPKKSKVFHQVPKLRW